MKMRKRKLALMRRYLTPLFVGIKIRFAFDVAYDYAMYRRLRSFHKRRYIA